MAVWGDVSGTANGLEEYVRRVLLMGITVFLILMPLAYRAMPERVAYAADVAWLATEFKVMGPLAPKRMRLSTPDGGTEVVRVDRVGLVDWVADDLAEFRDRFRALLRTVTTITVIGAVGLGIWYDVRDQSRRALAWAFRRLCNRVAKWIDGPRNRRRDLTEGKWNPRKGRMTRARALRYVEATPPLKSDVPPPISPAPPQPAPEPPAPPVAPAPPQFAIPLRPTVLDASEITFLKMLRGLDPEEGLPPKAMADHLEIIQRAWDTQYGSPSKPWKPEGS